jgi:outer membrane receptor for ferric coprogen and ferric-rhodotorulic acid
MKKPCENPNGLQNMATIVDSQTRKPVKFNSLDKAKEHLKSKGYRFRQAFNFKEDRSMIYQGRFGWVKLSSSEGFLNKTTMEQGTVWNIVKI